jgi:Ca-activated chloride channel family protein
MGTPSGAFRPNLITECGAAPRRTPAALAAALALALLSGAAAGAQFASGVNVVEVYATVVDRDGKPVRGLTKDDFTLKENGEPQQVSTFAAGEFPLSVAVALDRSFSMKGERLAVARSAARLFLGELRPGDESMILAVGSQTEVVAPLGRERTAQQEALSRLDAFGTTGLHDSIIAAIDHIQPAKGRRALVLLSDGTDRFSTATAADALGRARESDVLVYSVALGRTRPPLFAELAALTGGRSFHLQDPRRLPETLRAIAAELRHQYLIGYSPTRAIVAGSGEWRSIDVSVSRAGVTVRARDGYLVQ